MLRTSFETPGEGKRLYLRRITIYRDCSSVKAFLGRSRGPGELRLGGRRQNAPSPPPPAAADTIRAVILVDPQPRTLAMICDTETRHRLDGLGPVVIHEDGRMPDAMVDEHLPEVTAILGQTAMPAARLTRAEKLRAIVNVEGNFLPNVDYAAALDRR